MYSTVTVNFENGFRTIGAARAEDAAASPRRFARGSTLNTIEAGAGSLAAVSSAAA